MFDLLVPLATTFLSTQANNRATEQANEGIHAAAVAETEAINDYIAANYEGMEAQTRDLNNIYTQNLPGLTFMRNLVTRDNGLTPEQQYQLEDLRRVTQDNIQGSGFGGSARTAAALMERVEDGFVNTSMAQNRQESQAAAANLANVANNAAARKVDVKGQYFTNYGNAVVGAGEVAGNMHRQTSENIAGNTVANAQVTGQAIGDVAGVMAAENKIPRQSRFATV